VKLSIDGKVIAKARATSKKKAEEKASQRTYFALQEKMDKKYHIIKTTSFSFIN
jgi:ribonuclease-3